MAVARDRFTGPITYSAATWETADPDLIDVVGVSLYRAVGNEAGYRDLVRAMVGDRSQPAVVTELGCAAFAGADRRGAGSFGTINWLAHPPRIRGEYPRDESAQAKEAFYVVAERCKRAR